MILNQSDYQNKVLGCWLGKNIGGTLGAPYEWRRQVNQVSFYTQELGGEPLPNDDLDIQLLWLIALEEQGFDLDAHTLAEYWLLYLTPHWAEYGIAKANLRNGLPPPLSGTLNNPFKHSCGAWIRSEIWACLAPACPETAARFAYEDAILDHGDGEGTYAEVFCAALESAAFVESDLHILLEIGLSYIPADCGVAKAIQEAITCHQAGKTWLEARHSILSKYRGGTFFGNPEHTSPADRQHGFDQGELGYDAPSNLGMLAIGLLYGQGDFTSTLCTAVNCGEDTDCTGATAGAIYGLIHGADAIPLEWVAPIGRRIRTGTLNLGELGYYGNQLPGDVDALTRRTLALARQVIQRKNLPINLLSDQPTDLAGYSPASLYAPPFARDLFAHLAGPTYRFDFFDIYVDYGKEGPYLSPAGAKTLHIKVHNTYKTQAELHLRWYAPHGWGVSPSPVSRLFSTPWLGGWSDPVEFTLTCEQITSPLTRLVLEITSPGRPTAMLVPIQVLS